MKNVNRIYAWLPTETLSFWNQYKNKFSCMAKDMAQMSGEMLMPFLLLTISLGGQFWGMVISLKKKKTKEIKRLFSHFCYRVFKQFAAL